MLLIIYPATMVPALLKKKAALVSGLCCVWEGGKVFRIKGEIGVKFKS